MQGRFGLAYGGLRQGRSSSLRFLHPILVILAQSTVPSQPCKATFNDPGQTRDLERSLSSLDDPLQRSLVSWCCFRVRASFQPALIEIEDALVPGFFVEQHTNDRCTVFVPSVSTPMAGAIYIIATSPSRVHRLNLPVAEFQAQYSIRAPPGARVLDSVYSVSLPRCYSLIVLRGLIANFLQLPAFRSSISVQLLQPLTISNVALTSRNVLGLSRIDPLYSLDWADYRRMHSIWQRIFRMFQSLFAHGQQR